MSLCEIIFILVRRAIVSSLFTAVGIEDGKLPEKMADINELLRLLSNELTEQLFIQITNELFTPKTKLSERKA